MGDATNGDNKSRLDRIEQIVELLVNDHVQFREEHRQLLKAQVLLYDSTQRLHEFTQKLAQTQAEANIKLSELAEAQKHTDEKLAALIDVVDSLVRRTPPPPQ
jgi:hypothetical protein